MESLKRSIVKTIVWRLIGSFSTFFIVYIYTEQLTLSSGVGLTQLLINSGLYYFHERLWNAITWGKDHST